MSLSSRPVQPVPPESMELVFFYRCPGCGRRNPLIAPTQPSMTRCESCGEPFPVMPVDERTVHYVKIMLANGRATAFPFLFEQLLNAIKLPQSCVWDIVLMVGEP